MGGRIALRLLEAGYDVTGTTRSRDQADHLIAAGLAWTGTAREVAAGSAAVFCMLRDTASSSEVVFADDGLLAGLRPGSVLIDLATEDPAFLTQLGDALSGGGCDLLALPVTGTPRMAAAGTLSLIAGGSEARLNELDPVLRAFAQAITYVGSPEQAALVKLAINLSVAVQFIGFAEGMLLAERGGVPRERAVQAFMESALASPMLRQRGQFVLDPPTEPLADIALMRKDLALTLQAARRLAVALPLTAIANELASSAVALGHEHHDIATLWEPLAALAGAPRSSPDQK